MDICHKIKIASTLDISIARQQGKNAAESLGFNGFDQARIKTIVSELARNIYLYAKLGEIIIKSQREGSLFGMKINATDNGPGIQNVSNALTPGFTTSGGLGAGLSGVKEIADHFEIQTCPGAGTTITAIKWL